MRELDAKKLENNLRARAEEDMLLGKIACCAVRVLQHGEIVADLRFGVKDVRTGEPLPPHTLFRLASMTKPVTGVAALLALEKGWFDLYDKVSKHIPGFEKIPVGRMENGVPVPDHKPHTEALMWHLLTHTSGFSSEEPIGTYQRVHRPKSAYENNRAMLSHALAHDLLSFDPGEFVSYSGYLAFDAVACIIQEKSGMPYADFIKKNIFEPLGIEDITYHPTDGQWARVVTMHDKTTFPTQVAVDMGKTTFENFPLSYTCAGAGLVGSVEDYSVFAELLRRRGEYNGVRIFADKMTDVMTKPYVPEGTPGLSPIKSWGLGVRVTRHDPVLPDGCFGWSGAYGTHFWVDPENDVTAIYMKNNRWFDSHGAGNTGLQFEKDVMSSFKE
ncbi:MAG: serine hydrolase [Clostridia bacterium]|nr:serine hydrolase [Clostridia bacterium]